MSNTKAIENQKIYQHVKFEVDRKKFGKYLFIVIFFLIEKFSKKSFKNFERVTKKSQKKSTKIMV